MTNRSLEEIKNEYEEIEKVGMEYTARNVRFDELILELEQFHGQLPLLIPESRLNEESINLAVRINYAKFY